MKNKMSYPKGMRPLLLGLLLAAGSFMSIAVADTHVIAAAGGGAVAKSMSAEEAAKPMREEYLYRESNDTFALKFALTGVAIAIIFTVVSIAIGAGKNKG